jgi:ATP-dependent helicase/nuclease subunit A
VKTATTGGAAVQYKPKLTLISASAGTGKTYTLIQEITKVLENTSAEKIVAITFTRAATRDIRNKVKELGELNVNTIHGFFSSILREQALYFRKSIGFKILEEFDEQKLFMDSATRIMVKKAELDEFKELFIEHEFTKVLEMLFKMEKHYPTIRTKIKTDYKDLLKEEKQAQYKYSQELLPEDIENGIIKPLSEYKGEDGDKAEALRLSVLPIAKNLRPLSSWDDFYHNISVLKDLPDYNNRKLGSGKNWNPHELDLIQDIFKILNNARRAVEKDKLGIDWIMEQSAKFRKLYFDLFLEVHKAHQEKKTELDVLTYNDIELLTYDLVKKDPRVAKYYRGKYDHIFVDEFQDTNQMQRDVLFEIAKNIFVVGDAKQSIYRFRNADVRVFIDTQVFCPKEDQRELMINRRCLPSVVNAVNTAFTSIFRKNVSEYGRRAFEADYLSFESYRDESNGLVKLIKAPSQSSHHSSFNHELEARIALDIIQKNIAAGKNYCDHALLFRSSRHMMEFEKLFREKGIPFLVYGGESRNDLLNSLRCLFSIILDPNDNLSLLEVLKLPVFYMEEKDIYSLITNKNKELISKAYSEKNTPNPPLPTIWESLGSHPVKDFVNTMRKRKDLGSFTEFVSDVLRVSKFIESSSLLFMGQDAGAQEAILRTAMHVESQGEGIEYFLDFLYSMKQDEVASKIDAVKFMTIHASKGLEFNTVIMPCLDTRPHAAKDIVVISDNGDVAVKLGEEDSNKKFNTVLYKNIKSNEEEADLAESKRLLYVAMTRARDELYMISDFDKDKKGLEGNMWVNWLNSVFSEVLEDYKLEEETKNKVPRVKVIRTLDTDIVRNGLNELESEDENVLKRYSVSFIRDSFRKKEYKTSFGKKGLGSIVHSVLENWEDKEEVDNIYKRIGKASDELICNIIDPFIASDIGKKIFCSSSYLCEHPFCVIDDGKIISGRIDRINIYDDSVWVIDYKTGVQEDDLDAYMAQINCYAAFAKKAFKGKKIQASIIDVLECKEYKG